jgi:mitogen-activated protein kinase organizer 1
MDPAHPSFALRQAPNRGQDVSIDSLPHALPIHSYTDGHTHPVSAIAVDDVSTTLLSASEKTLVWTNVVAQKVQRRFHGHLGRIHALAISQGTETFLSASYDGTVRIWDARSRSPEPIQILKEAKDSVTGVHTVQSPGEAVIRSCSVDGVVRTYDLRKGQVQCDDTHNAIFSMALTHDGQCLAISCLDATIRLMEVDTGELLNTYSSCHVAGNYSLQCTLTADDANIVTGSEDGGAVLYDLVRGEMVQELRGHWKPTCAVATHPKRENSSVVITASYDGNDIVWANDSSYIQWQE